jgi:stage V sporulation protein SpoVS
MSQDSDIIRVGKNAKVSALAERVIKQLERQGGLVRLEAVGAGAVNEAVKAVAQARRSGYLLAIIPDLVDVPLGHGTQPAVQLTVVDME